MDKLTQTIYVKVPVSERLPKKTGQYYTNKGILIFYTNENEFEHCYGSPTFWLEEQPLPPSISKAIFTIDPVKKTLFKCTNCNYTGYDKTEAFSHVCSETLPSPEVINPEIECINEKWIKERHYKELCSLLKKIEDETGVIVMLKSFQVKGDIPSSEAKEKISYEMYEKMLEEKYINNSSLPPAGREKPESTCSHCKLQNIIFDTHKLPMDCQYCGKPLSSPPSPAVRNIEKALAEFLTPYLDLHKDGKNVHEFLAQVIVGEFFPSISPPPAGKAAEDKWDEIHESFITSMKIESDKSTYQHLQEAFYWFKNRFQSQPKEGEGKTVCVSCDEGKEIHEICMDCITKLINENQQTDHPKEGEGKQGVILPTDEEILKKGKELYQTTSMSNQINKDAMDVDRQIFYDGAKWLRSEIENQLKKL